MTAIPCANWINGACGIGHRAKPSAGFCLRNCEVYDGPDRGLGDWVKRMLKSIHADKMTGDCGCARRQAKMNALAGAKWVRTTLETAGTEA